MSKSSKLNVPGVYFIEDAGGIKIGSASNIETRRTDLQTANSAKLKVIGIIECDKGRIQKEEKIAHDYFAENRIHLEWFDKNIKRELKKYIEGRQGVLVEEENKKLNKNLIATLYGEKPITSMRPRCYFYTHLPAAILGRRGINEKYRKVFYNGKQVYVSGRKWYQLLTFKKEYRKFLGFDEEFTKKDYIKVMSDIADSCQNIRELKDLQDKAISTLAKR